MPIATGEERPSRRTTVLHVEDCPLWAQAVADAIGRWPEFRLVGTVPLAADALTRCRELQPAIVILDLRLPDADGLTVAANLRAASPAPRILFLTSRIDEVALHHGTSTHVSGMLLKSQPFDHELRFALTTVAAGGRFLSRAAQQQATKYHRRPDSFSKILSDRELEVIDLIAAGLEDDEIAATLGLSVATAHCHRQRIMSKAGVHSSAKLAAWAREKGFGQK